MVRTSERLLFKRCRWAWDRDFNDRLRPRRTAPALRFGSLVHSALEAYYKPGTKRGPAPAKTFWRLFQADVEEQGALGYHDEDGKWSDAGEMGVQLLEDYVVEYGKDERYEVVMTEQAFQVPILHPKTGRLVATYTGILDGIWRDLNDGLLFVEDHKTAAVINTTHLALDEQAGAYWTFGQDWIRERGLLKPDEELAGMLYNFLRKAKRDDRPQNADGHYLNKPAKAVLLEAALKLPVKKERVKKLPVDDLIKLIDKRHGKGAAAQLGEISKDQPAPRFYREKVWRDEADREAVRARVLEELREMRLVRRGKLTAYKNPGAMTCNMCGYRDICELHETGHDWEEVMHQTMETWDPYAAHEIEDAERR
jgi:hypothetical protein